MFACGVQIIAVSQVLEVQLVELGARRSGEKAPDIAEKAAFFGELLWIVRRSRLFVRVGRAQVS